MKGGAILFLGTVYALGSTICPDRFNLKLTGPRDLFARPSSCTTLQQLPPCNTQSIYTP